MTLVFLGPFEMSRFEERRATLAFKVGSLHLSCLLLWMVPDWFGAGVSFLFSVVLLLGLGGEWSGNSYVRGDEK